MSLKRSSAFVLWVSGITHLSRRLLAQRGRFVLLFHGVVRQPYSDFPAAAQPYPTQDQLRSIFGWLRERFDFLTSRDLMESRKPGVLLTFDDGLANNHTNVVPVLAEFNAPAVFFVTTQHMIQPNDWLPATRQLLAEHWNGRPVPPEVAVDLFDGMSRGQIAELGQHPLVEIGSHSVTHPLLTQCGSDRLRLELEESRRQLQEVSGQPVDLFAYPTGDYDRRVAEAVRAAGYRAAFAMESYRIGLPAFEIPRIGIYASDRAYLSVKLSGLHRKQLLQLPTVAPGAPGRSDRPGVESAAAAGRGPALTAVPDRSGEPPPVRLLFLIGQLGFGGSERQLYLLLKHLDRGRFEPHVVVFNPSSNLAYDQVLLNYGVRIYNIPERTKSIAGRLWYLVRTMRRVQPDLVHSWTAHDNAYAGIAGWLAGIPVRWGSVRSSIFSNEGLVLPPLYRYLSLYSVSRMVVNSESLGSELLAKGYPARRILILPNCVMTSSEMEPLLAAGSAHPWNRGTPDQFRFIGLVGNLRKFKNHMFFVQAMAAILPRFPQVRALIVGQPIASEPEQPALLQAEIERLGLTDKVLLTGFRTDVQQLMRQMEVVCQASKCEGMPNALLEAMAAERPVVATRVGGTSELVEDGISGWLIEPGDLAGFSAAVMRLLEQPELARRMGLAGGRRARELFGCERSTRQFESLYHQAVSEKTRAARAREGSA
ncbi:MAG TPA: glycosyltransferase [Acidobacteriota bacterium]